MKKAILFATIIVLAGCNDRELRDLRDENIQLQSRVDELEAKIEDAKGKAGDLESEVSRFSDENWQDVVPDVESAAQEVSSALDD